MTSTDVTKIDADDAERIAQTLMADAVSGQYKVLRGREAMAVLLDEGLPTERALVVNVDGAPVDLDEAGLFVAVSDLVHYALEGECCCEERSDPDGPITTSPVCPAHGRAVRA